MARALALDVLIRVEQDSLHADVALSAALATSGLSTRDRGLASRLVYGTLAWQGLLDWHLTHLLNRANQANRPNRDPATLDPYVRTVLRLGLHQILLLDRVPDHAAVATSVDLIKRHVPAASGLVNAILRRAIRERAQLPLPDPVHDPTAHLATALSHPEWIVKLWQARFEPGGLRDLLTADNEAAPTVLRARPGDREALIARLTAADHPAEPGRFGPDAVRVQAADPHGLSGWAEGAFSVQSEASQLVVRLLDPQPGERILDACAAPGGKTTYAAELMDDRGLIVALDHRRRGARAIARNAKRLRLHSIAALALDARAADAAFPPATFDRILVDAPCSGLGTLRAHPEIRWRRHPEDLVRFAMQQGRILESVTPLLKPNGVIVYSTCTLTREENEDVVSAWLAAHPELSRENASAHLPAAAAALVDDTGALCTLPHRDDLDGFFAVRARRR